MPRVLLGFDDTDVLGAPIGTGRLVRMFEDKLPASARLWGVLRHQLLVDDAIPYTSHNSPAIAVVDVPDRGHLPDLIARAAAHIHEFASPGSDPGLCAAFAEDDLSALIAFGRACTHRLASQDEARAAAAQCGAHLSGHGGTNDGIIGAAAAVGLTAWGWSGRFLEYGRLRALPAQPSIAELAAAGIIAAPLEHEACVLPDELRVVTRGWISPRLWGGRAVLPLLQEDGQWIAVGKRPRDAEVAE